MPSIAPSSARLRPAVFLFLLVAGRAWGASGWVLPDSQLGRLTAPLLLLSRPEIQADLKMEPRAVAALGQAVSELHGKAYALRGRRDPEAVAARRAIDDAQRLWLESHLTDAQRARLGQLDLQWEGPSALHTRKALAETLRLTETQRKRIDAAVATRESRRASAGRDPRADDAALAEAVLVLLDEDQRERWKTMLGPACRFQVGAGTQAQARAEAPAR